MSKKVLWFIGCVLGAVLPVALAIAHSHYKTGLDNDTQQIIASVEAVVKNRSLSKDQKQLEIITLIAKKRASATTLFVYDTNGKMIFHPDRPEFNGRILTSHADPIIANAFRDLVKSANAYSESQVAYYWPDSVAGQLQNQVAYIRKLDNWNWVFAASHKQSAFYDWQAITMSIFAIAGLLFFTVRLKFQHADASSVI